MTRRSTRPSLLRELACHVSMIYAVESVETKRWVFRSLFIGGADQIILNCKNSPQMSGSVSKITLMFALVTDFPPRRSCGGPLTNIAGAVIVTISPIRLRTKYVLMHECVPFMLSSPSAVSIIVTFSFTSLPLMRELVIVCEAPQSRQAVQLHHPSSCSPI